MPVDYSSPLDIDHNAILVRLSYTRTARNQCCKMIPAQCLLVHSYKVHIWNKGESNEFLEWIIPDSKVHGANMGPIWDQQDPGGTHVGPMNYAIWDCFVHINSLRPRRFELNFRYVIFKLILMIDGWGASCEFTFRWCHWTSLVISQHCYR